MAMDEHVAEAIEGWLRKKLNLTAEDELTNISFAQVSAVEGCETCGWGGSDGGAAISYRLNNGRYDEYLLDQYSIAEFLNDTMRKPESV